MGWGPVEWVWRVLPEAKFEKNAPRFLKFLDLSDQGRVLPEAKFKKQFNKENAPIFLIFLFERTLLRYLQKTVFGDQLNGLGTS